MTQKNLASVVLHMYALCHVDRDAGKGGAQGGDLASRPRPFLKGGRGEGGGQKCPFMKYTL